jgi:hypothetical protein
MADHVYMHACWVLRSTCSGPRSCAPLWLVVPWPHPDGNIRPIFTYPEPYSGFGSAAVIMIGAMFVIGSAIVQTGVAEARRLRLLRRFGDRERQLQLSVLCVATVTSMFINDIQ